jgi:uncharacterized membrane protein
MTLDIQSGATNFRLYQVYRSISGGSTSRKEKTLQALRAMILVVQLSLLHSSNLVSRDEMWLLLDEPVIQLLIARTFGHTQRSNANDI